MQGMKISAQRGHPAVSIWSPYRFPNLYGNLGTLAFGVRQPHSWSLEPIDKGSP